MLVLFEYEYTREYLSIISECHSFMKALSVVRSQSHRRGAARRGHVANGEHGVGHQASPERWRSRLGHLRCPSCPPSRRLVWMSTTPWSRPSRRLAKADRRPPRPWRRLSPLPPPQPVPSRRHLPPTASVAVRRQGVVLVSQSDAHGPPWSGWRVRGPPPTAPCCVAPCRCRSRLGRMWTPVWPRPLAISQLDSRVAVTHLRMTALHENW